MARNKSEKAPVLIRRRPVRHQVHDVPEHTLRLLRIDQSEWRLTLFGAGPAVAPCSKDFDDFGQANQAYLDFPDGFNYTQNTSGLNGWFQNPDAKLSAT